VRSKFKKEEVKVTVREEQLEQIRKQMAPVRVDLIDAVNIELELHGEEDEEKRIRVALDICNRLAPPTSKGGKPTVIMNVNGTTWTRTCYPI